MEPNEVWDLKPVKQNWFADSQRNESWLASRDPTRFENKLPFNIEDPAWHFPRTIQTKLKLGNADFEDLDETWKEDRRAANADELPPSDPFEGARSSKKSNAERAGLSPAPLPVASLLESEKKPPAKRGGQVASAPTPIGAATPASSRSAVRSALSAGGAPPVALPTPIHRQILVHHRKSPGVAVAAAAATALPASPEAVSIAETAKRVVGAEIAAVQASQSKTAAEWEADPSLEQIVLYVGDIFNQTFSRRPTAKAVAAEVKKILSPSKPPPQALADAIKATASEVVSHLRKGDTPKPKTPAKPKVRSAGVGPPPRRRAVAPAPAAAAEPARDAAGIEAFKAAYLAEHHNLRGWNKAYEATLKA